MSHGRRGGSIVGLSSAYALVDQGVAVRLHEAGLPREGQSASESRIFRHAHDDPRLVAFVRAVEGGLNGSTSSLKPFPQLSGGGGGGEESNLPGRDPRPQRF